MTTVVNIRHEQFDEYCGRGSIFGNPFEIGLDGERERVIERYRNWFYHTIKDNRFKEAVLSLRGKKLGCFCKQLDKEVACHVDVIVEYLNQNGPRKTYSGYITHLSDNQVFVFGSNRQGFHGAGAAGYASFGIAGGNHWRSFDYAKKPNGWIGNWNIKGVAKGFQQGMRGKSYAIPTVDRAGAKRSLTLVEIAENIAEMYAFAKEHPEWEFLVAQENKMGLNGYTPVEMAQAFNAVPIPDNIIFEEGFSKLLS